MKVIPSVQYTRVLSNSPQDCHIKGFRFHFTGGRWQRQLTHWGRVTHISVSKLTIIGSDNGFIAWWVQSHYLNQWWNIVSSNLRNKRQWSLERYSYIFVHENAFEYVVCEMSAIFSQSQCVKSFSMRETEPVLWALFCRQPKMMLHLWNQLWPYSYKTLLSRTYRQI